MPWHFRDSLEAPNGAIPRKNPLENDRKKVRDGHSLSRAFLLANHPSWIPSPSHHPVTTQSPPSHHPVSTQSPPSLHPISSQSPPNLHPISSQSPPSLHPVSTQSPPNLHPISSQSPPNLHPVSSQVHFPISTQSPPCPPTHTLSVEAWRSD